MSVEFVPQASLVSPADIPGSPLGRAFEQPMMLGVFLNLQDIQRSQLPSSNTWTFDYNAAIVQQADALGFELAFSRTQWLPKGGYDGDASLDAFVALGAMAAITKRILRISPNTARHSITYRKVVGASTWLPATVPLSTRCSAGTG